MLSSHHSSLILLHLVIQSIPKCLDHFFHHGENLIHTIRHFMLNQNPHHILSQMSIKKCKSARLEFGKSQSH